MKLDPRTRKLLLLAFDPGATPDESLAALRVVFRDWLFRYQDGHELVKDLESGRVEVREKIVYRNENPYANFVLNFGKHRGERLRDIPVSYLIWCLEDWDGLWPATRRAIEKYLEGE